MPYCAVPFTAPNVREHCSPRCRDLHRWYGVVPDAHRHIVVRRADYNAARRTSTTPTNHPEIEETNR